MVVIEEDTIKLLRECDAGIKMGVEAIDEVIQYVNSPELKQYLEKNKSDHEKLKSELQKFTHETKIDVSEINKELLRTRQKGYCILSDELAENKASIAAAVFDRHRCPVAAISVSASAHSLSQPQRERELAKAVMTTAGKISAKLGYYPK